MAGFHTTALTQRCIARAHTREALLRIAEEEATGHPDRLAMLFDFSGIAEIENRLFFRAVMRFLEERTTDKPLAVAPIALNCIVLITDSTTAQAILDQMTRLAHFLRDQRHGSFEVSCFDLKHGHRHFAETLRRLAMERPVPPPDRSLCLSEEAPPDKVALDRLITVGGILGRTDIDRLLRNQAIWFFPQDAAPVKVGREFWLSMNAVETLLGLPLQQDAWLFERTTQFADHRMLAHLRQAEQPFPLPYSINLHLATIFTGNFRRLASQLQAARPHRPAQRHNFIVELPAQECLRHPEAFATAADLLDEQGICLAVDRLSWQNLQALPEAAASRATYLKIPWSTVQDHIAGRIDEAGADSMAALVERFGADKIVLTRCDRPDAVECSLRLGIRRFQGRGINRFMFSTRSVERVLGRRAANRLVRSLDSRLARLRSGSDRRYPEYYI